MPPIGIDKNQQCPESDLIIIIDDLNRQDALVTANGIQTAGNSATEAVNESTEPKSNKRPDMRRLVDLFNARQTATNDRARERRDIANEAKELKNAELRARLREEKYPERLRIDRERKKGCAG